MKKTTQLGSPVLSLPLLAVLAAFSGCSKSSDSGGSGASENDALGSDGDAAQAGAEPCEVERADPARGSCEPWFELRDDTALSADDFYRVRFVTAGDLNDDGLTDVVVAEPFTIFENQGGLDFSPVKATGQIRETTTSVALADLDNDGDLDLVTLDQDWIEVHRNLGDYAFEKIFEGIGSDSLSTHLLFADVNGDGFVDIFVTYPPEAAQGRPEVPPVLLMNEGGETLAREGQEFFADVETYAWSASLFPPSGDSTSIFVAADGGIEDFGFEEQDNWDRSENENRLFEFGGDACGGAGGCSAMGAELSDGTPLSERASEFEIQGPHSSMGGLVEDFDADGDFDLFVTDYGRNKLYLADGRRFTENAQKSGLGASHRVNAECDEESESADCLLVSWGALYEDFNLDGVRDLIVLNHNETGVFEQPIQLYVKDGEESLEFEERSLGLGDIAATAGIPSDFDQDGDLDILVTTHRGVPVILENHSSDAESSSLLRVQLEGTSNHRDGQGAVVEAHMESGLVVRRVVGGGGVSRASLPPEVHFTGADSIESLQVIWPNGESTTVEEPAGPSLLVTE